MLCNTRRSLVDLIARLKENGSACVFMKHDLFCTAAPRLPFLSFTKVKREMKRYKRKSEYKVMSQHQYVNSGGQPRYKKNEWYLSACTGGHRVVKVTVSQQRNRLGLTGRLLPFVLFSPFFFFFFYSGFNANCCIGGFVDGYLFASCRASFPTASLPPQLPCEGSHTGPSCSPELCSFSGVAPPPPVASGGVIEPGGQQPPQQLPGVKGVLRGALLFRGRGSTAPPPPPPARGAVGLVFSVLVGARTRARSH